MLTLAARRRTLPAKRWGRTMRGVQAARKKLFRRAACASGPGIKLSCCRPRCSQLASPGPRSAAGHRPGWSGPGGTGTALHQREGSLQHQEIWCFLQRNPPIFPPVAVGKARRSFCPDEPSNVAKEPLPAAPEQVF